MKFVRELLGWIMPVVILGGAIWAFLAMGSQPPPARKSADRPTAAPVETASVEPETGGIDVVADGAELRGRARALIALGAEQAARGIPLVNRGTRDVWATTTTSYVPAAPLPAANRRLTLSRAHYTLDGRPANLAALRQNDRVVVWLEIGGLTDLDREAKADLALADLLPAGLEIEAPLRPVDEDGTTRFAFLGKLGRAALVEARDDRFVAALRAQDLEGDRHGFGYVARAVTPGRYVLR